MSFPCRCKQEQHCAQPLLCPFQRQAGQKNTLLLPCLHLLPCSPHTPVMLAAGSTVPTPLRRVCSPHQWASLWEFKVQSERQQKIEAGMHTHHIVYF